MSLIRRQFDPVLLQLGEEVARPRIINSRSAATAHASAGTGSVGCFT